MPYPNISSVQASSFALLIGLSAGATLMGASQAQAQEATGSHLLPSEGDANSISPAPDSPDFEASSQPEGRVFEIHDGEILETTATATAVSTRANDLLLQPGDRFSTHRRLPMAALQLAQDAQDAGDTPLEEMPAEAQDDELDVQVTDRGRFTFGIGSFLDEPTALEGPTRDRPVAADSTTLSLVSFNGYLRQQLDDNQAVLLEFVADPQLLGFDLSYTVEPESIPGMFTVNVFNQRSLSPSFEDGDREVDLFGGEDPRVHRIGGGIEYTYPVTPALAIAGAANYQRISVRDSLFTDDIESIDELGNPVVVSEDGQDDLLIVSLSGLYDQVSGEGFSLDGTRIRFGMDQSIPVGETDVLFNRLVANATQFIPLRIFTGEPGTLVLNVQAGGTFGDVPPYETLNLGGTSTVRGFEKGEVGSGTSFVQATAEYRFPLFDFNAFSAPIGIGGMVFVDYASDLGTADEVIGDPADVREKPGDGLGYGLGIHGVTPIGLIRAEFGFNDDGGSQFHFAIGDRF